MVPQRGHVVMKMLPDMNVNNYENWLDLDDGVVQERKSDNCFWSTVYTCLYFSFNLCGFCLFAMFSYHTGASRYKPVFV